MTTFGHPEGTADHSRTSGRASRPLSNFREELSTAPRLLAGPSDHCQISSLLPDIPEALRNTPGLPGGPPDYSRISRRATRTPSDITEGLSTTPWTSGWDSRPLPDIRDIILNTPRHQKGPPDYSRIERRAFRPLPEIREGLMTTPGHPEGPPDHSWTYRRASRPLPDNREGLPTTPGHPGGPPNHSRNSGSSC